MGRRGRDRGCGEEFVTATALFVSGALEEGYEEK
jgi:hypothetical protein